MQGFVVCCDFDWIVQWIYGQGQFCFFCLQVYYFGGYGEDFGNVEFFWCQFVMVCFDFGYVQYVFDQFYEVLIVFMDQVGIFGIVGWYGIEELGFYDVGEIDDGIEWCVQFMVD